MIRVSSVDIDLNDGKDSPCREEQGRVGQTNSNRGKQVDFNLPTSNQEHMHDNIEESFV